MKALWSLPLLICLCCCHIAPALAWGPGHEDTQRELNARLPAPLRAALTPELLVRSLKDSKYLDSFAPFEPERIGQKAFDDLLARGIKKRYDLHADQGRAIAFIMLVRALREKQYEHANFWVAMLGHSAADMVACNHDPLVHVATYSWAWKEWQMTLPNGKPFAEVAPFLDLMATARDKTGNQIFQGKIEAMQLRDDGRDADKALLDIMMYGQQGAAFCAPRGVPILRDVVAWLDRRDDAAHTRYQENISELGAWAIVRVLRDVEVAMRLAQSEAKVELTPAIQAAYEKQTDEILRARKLSDEGLYAPILRDLPAGGGATGVLLEPVWRMDETFLGFGERTIAASVCRTLQEAGRATVTLDVREIVREGFPAPAQMPTLIIAARGPSSYHWLKTDDLDGHLQKYLDAGGKVLWIGGGKPRVDALKSFADSMKTGTDNRWPLPLDELLQSSVQLAPPAGTDAAQPAWKFVRTPTSYAGWHIPASRYFFIDGSKLGSLLEVRHGDQTMTIGAAWPIEQPRAAFLPTYAVFPHLFTPDPVIEEAAQPRLDSAGQTMLLRALAALDGKVQLAQMQPKDPAAPPQPQEPVAVAAAVAAPVPLAQNVEPGAVSVSGEQFMRDGAPLRLWGVNFNLQSWTTPAGMDAMVDRIAATGFNAVRAWPNREAFYGVEPSGSKAPPQGPIFRQYQKGDGSLFDVYDRGLARFRARGVGVYSPALLYYPPYFAQFSDVVKTTADDEAAWKAAMTDLSRDEIYWNGRVLHYVDERIGALLMRHASNFLEHVNPYTGLRNADDNNFVLWDANNESRFLWQQLLENTYRDGGGKPAWRPYFQNKLTEKWNTWLRQKYGTTAKLRQSWGELAPDETLENATVRTGTAFDKKAFGRQRVGDFTAFGMELVTAWNTKFLAHIRSHASRPDQGVAVAPINADTYHITNLPNFAVAAQGSSMAVGIYPAGQQFMPGGKRKTDAPQFPWDPLLTHAYDLPIFDQARPADKPVVVYETNYNSFALYNAEFPWILAAYSSWQNYAGVFWYHFNVPNANELPDPYGDKTFAYRGNQIWGDEVFSSALLAAGDAFKSRALPMAPDPTIITYSREAASDPAWQRFSFAPADKNAAAPRLNGLSLEQAKRLYDLTKTTAFERGHRIAVQDGARFDVSVKGALTTEEGERLEAAKGLKWEWRDGLLVLDLPQVKAVVGFVQGAKFAWSDGFAVEGLNEPFVAIGLVSLDGQPLAQSRRVRLSAVSHSYDEGMKLVNSQQGLDEAGLAAGNIKGTTMKNGDGATVVRRLNARFSWPAAPGRTATMRDFKLRALDKVEAASGLQLTPQMPVFDVLLERP